MSTTVRVALDIEVEKGDPEKVAQAIFDGREKILDFATAVVLANDEGVGIHKAKSMAGNSHIHSVDGERCTECVRYSGRPVLALVEGYNE